VQFGLHSEVEREDIAGFVDRRTKSCRSSVLERVLHELSGVMALISDLLECCRIITSFIIKNASLISILKVHRLLCRYLFPEDLQEMSISTCTPIRLLYSSIVPGDQMEHPLEAHRLHICKVCLCLADS
jgi:hypothetical protein